jgi:hypothetical protein
MILSSAIDESVEITITNVVGEKVRELTMQSNKTMQIELNDAMGIYFVSAYTAHGNYVVKVVLVK